MIQTLTHAVGPRSVDCRQANHWSGHLQKKRFVLLSASQAENRSLPMEEDPRVPVGRVKVACAVLSTWFTRTYAFLTRILRYAKCWGCIHTISENLNTLFYQSIREQNEMFGVAKNRRVWYPFRLSRRRCTGLGLHTVTVSVRSTVAVPVPLSLSSIN